MKYVAKPNTWFKAGTTVKLIDFHYELTGDKVGLFEGTRVCENPTSEPVLRNCPKNLGISHLWIK